jgi:hypothetical protein
MNGAYSIGYFKHGSLNGFGKVLHKARRIDEGLFQDGDFTPDSE